VDQAGTAISIMAGGQIRPPNIDAVLRETGVQEIHASALDPIVRDSTDPLGLVLRPRIANPATVRALAVALREVRSRDRSE